MRGIVTGAAIAVAACVLATDATAASQGPHRSTPLIVGGTTAPAGTWPWLAAVYDSDSDTFCSGTVVAPDLVLTAAHCVEDLATNTLYPAGGFTVITGALDWADSATGERSSVSEVMVHAHTWTSVDGVIDNIVGDAGLLELATPTTAPPITLATPSDAALIGPGTPAQVAGWGETYDGGPTVTSLQAASTVVQSGGYCSGHQPAFDALAQLCTVDAPSDVAATCFGDSGGPLVVADGSTWIEVGITSTTTQCNPDQPGYFTRVDYVEPWIEGWIDALSAPSAPGAAAPSTPAPPTAAPSTPIRTSEATPPNAPGLYRGLSSQHRHISIRIAPNGEHVTSVHIGVDLSCQNDHVAGFTEAWTSTLSISAAHTVTTHLYAAPGRSWHHGVFTLTLTIGTDSTITGRLAGSERALHDAAGRCLARDVAFTLTRR